MKKPNRKVLFPLFASSLLIAAAAAGSGLPTGQTAEAAHANEARTLTSTGSESFSASSSAQPSTTIDSRIDKTAETAESTEFMQLQQMNFLSATTGWVVRAGNSRTQKQPLRLLVTQDGSRSWTKQKLPGQYAAGLGLSSADSGWALVYDGSKKTSGTVAYSRARLLHTADGGKSWQTQWSRAGTYTDSFPPQNNVVVTGNKSAYAIVGNQLLMTRDGRTWSGSVRNQPGFVPEHLSFSDAQNGWAAGTMPSRTGAVDDNVVAVLHTADGGRSWNRQLAAGPTDEDNSDSSSLRSAAIDFADAKNGFMLTDDISMMAGDLYRTTDGGHTWTKVYAKLRSHRPTLVGLSFIDGKKGWIYASPGAGPIDGGLMITRDGGKSFASEPDAGYDLSFAEYFASGNGYAVGRTANGQDYLSRTRDGGDTWKVVYPAK